MQVLKKLARTILITSLCFLPAACATNERGKDTLFGIQVLREQPRDPAQRRCTYGATLFSNSTDRAVEFRVGVARGLSSVNSELVITVPPETEMNYREFPVGQPAQMRMRPGEVAAVVLTPEGGVPSQPTVIRQMPANCSDTTAVNFIFSVYAVQRGSGTYAVVRSGVPR